MAAVISIVIPLYNKEESLAKTLDSILIQTYCNFEVIIVNDGSTDNSLEVVDSYQDRRIKLYTKENGGVSDTRNYGIEHSNGEYIFLLDADDLILPDCLMTLTQLIEKFPDEKVYCGNFNIVEKGTVSRDIVCEEINEGVYHNPIQKIWEGRIFPRTGTLLFKANCINSKTMFDTRLSYYEDLDFIIRLLNFNSIVYSPKVIFSYVLDHNELSTNVISLQKDWCFYMSFKNKSLYEVLIFSEVFFNNLKLRFTRRDSEGFKVLILKKIYLVPLFVLVKLYKVLTTKINLFKD